MRVRLIFFIFIEMALSTVLKNIQNIEPNVNRREALIKTIVLAPKLANNIERIYFLVQCRKAHITPKFIEGIISKTSVSKGFYGFLFRFLKVHMVYHLMGLDETNTMKLFWSLYLNLVQSYCTQTACDLR